MTGSLPSDEEVTFCVGVHVKLYITVRVWETVVLDVAATAIL